MMAGAVLMPSVHRRAAPAPPSPAPEEAAEQEEQEEDEDEEPEREEEEREVAEARARSDDCPHDEADHNCDADQEEERCDPPTDELSMPNDFTIRLHACHGGPPPWALTHGRYLGISDFRYRKTDSSGKG